MSGEREMRRRRRPVRYTERVVYLTTPQQYRALAEAAERNGRTVSAEIRYAVTRHLESQRDV